MRLTTPPMADMPYSADATPLITSTCPRSIGGICSSPMRSGLAAVQRQAVGQDLRVPAAKTLDPDVRTAEGGRGGLDAQAVGLVEQHRDVAWRHHQLFLDFLPRHDFDSHRLVVQPLAGARAGDHGDGLFDGRRRLQVHHDVLLRARRHLHRRGRGDVAGLHDGQLDGAAASPSPSTVPAESVWCVRAGDEDFGVCDRLVGRTNLDPNRGSLLTAHQRRYEKTDQGTGDEERLTHAALRASVPGRTRRASQLN